MAVKDHKLFLEMLENVWVWAQKHAKEHFTIPFPRGSGIKLSPKQHYEHSCYYWSHRLENIFDRLKNIRIMTGRSLYRKKTEVKSVLIQEWILYNYEHYTIVYQGILDVALLLTNAILELGNPHKKCSYDTICENTKVNRTNVHHILKKIQDSTKKHREGKNMFVHQGERVDLPVDRKTYDTIDLVNIATTLGLEINNEYMQLVAEFLQIVTTKEIIKIMENECKEIESQTEELLTALSPHYHRIHSLYV